MSPKSGPSLAQCLEREVSSLLRLCNGKGRLAVSLHLIGLIYNHLHRPVQQTGVS